METHPTTGAPRSPAPRLPGSPAPVGPGAKCSLRVVTAGDVLARWLALPRGQPRAVPSAPARAVCTSTPLSPGPAAGPQDTAGRTWAWPSLSAEAQDPGSLLPPPSGTSRGRRYLSVF